MGGVSYREACNLAQFRGQVSHTSLFVNPAPGDSGPLSLISAPGIKENFLASFCLSKTAELSCACLSLIGAFI